MSEIKHITYTNYSKFIVQIYNTVYKFEDRLVDNTTCNILALSKTTLKINTCWKKQGGE